MAEVVAKYVSSLYSDRHGKAGNESVGSESSSIAPPPPTQIDRNTIQFFTGLKAPDVGFEDYTRRIARYSRCPPECFIFALAYIRRAAASGFPINDLTVHCLLITAVVVATKVRDDCCVNLDFYSRVGGVTRAELVRMEIHFLKDVIDFSAEVWVEEYLATCQSITTAVTADAAKASKSLQESCGISEDGTPGQVGKAVPLAAAGGPASVRNRDVCTRASMLEAWASECQAFLP